jgi:hypothetical protein
MSLLIGAGVVALVVWISVKTWAAGHDAKLRMEYRLAAERRERLRAYVPLRAEAEDDPNLLALVNRVFETGRPHLGEVDEGGVLHIIELGDDGAARR